MPCLALPGPALPCPASFISLRTSGIFIFIFNLIAYNPHIPVDRFKIIPLPAGERPPFQQYNDDHNQLD
jgi:hypothetical protein